MDPLRVLADHRCVVCDARGAVLCASCRPRLPWLVGPLCDRCGEPDPRIRLRCALCERLGGGVASARSAIAHDAVGGSIVRAWKDAARTPVATLAASCIAAAVPPPAADWIVPVPAARARAAWRGVDGPAALATLLGRAWELPVRGDVLVRVRDRPQRGLTAAQRRRNASGSMSAAGRIVGRVVLVDDVLTTGATVRAAATSLRRAGAERVDVVTFARVATIP
ncbi:MAG: ComF family protein [Gaiellales bacterium]